MEELIVAFIVIYALTLLFIAVYSIAIKQADDENRHVLKTQVLILGALILAYLVAAGVYAQNWGI